MIHRIVLPAIVFMCVGCGSHSGGSATQPATQPAAAPAQPSASDTASTAASAGIEDIEWHLTRLGSAPAVVGDPQNPPRLTLQSSDKLVTGSGGCNRMTGPYTLDGNKLTFGQIAGTMMMCIAGMEQEHEFHLALAKVTSWRMNGAALELLDADNTPVVTLEQKQ
ncbi:MAG TPA: META domain-containing protein [Povalibacter sp.]|nr:META domain-containing protein [Povalibacter sp.]